MTERRVQPGPVEELDRSRTIDFRFDGHSCEGFQGDSIGSALAACGQDVLSRSFKYHRPRAMLCASGRCPNCMVNVDGAPNVRACVTPIAPGMRVRSQNARPSLRRDVMALTDRFDRFLPVGFYYKTFIRPRRLWPLYERVLRNAAGLGRIDIRSRPKARPAKRHLHCDVAVIGGGPAGCLAALEAAAGGARVVLVDEAAHLGGQLTFRSRAVEGDPRVAAPSGFAAAERLATLVAAEPRIEHLASATAFGLYEGGLVAISQAGALVRLRAMRIVVATGDAEHPALFDANDRPGVMLASGMLRLRHLQGVVAATRVVVITDDDHGWHVAAELVAAGIPVSALVDRRHAGTSKAGRPGRAALEAARVRILTQGVPLGAVGRHAVTGLRVSTPAGEETLVCDGVAVAMRPEPVIGLLAQAGATPRYDERLGEFLPHAMPADLHAAGGVLGITDDQLLAVGAILAGREAAAGALHESNDDATRTARAEHDRSIAAARDADVDAADLRMPVGRKAFVCLCEDVTVKELAQGVREGFAELETLKRYSTVTMGPCQGKMCHGLAARVHAQVSNGSPASSGLTTSRPPFQPVTLSALAGPHLSPIRRTAMHDRHAALGARFIDMGDWKRPFAYGDVADEVRAVRAAAGLIDVSTLGKLWVEGPDAGVFLDWLHPNRFSDMAIGRVRYRAMLDDAGIIIDDGTVARLGPDRFLVSTTTGNIESVDQWFRWWLAGSPRDARVINVTSQLAAVNLAGPQSRVILERLTDIDVSRDALPYMAAAEGLVAGVPAVLLRIGFVGELGFEIHVPADYGAHLWDTILAAGTAAGIRPFGVEAQRVLRLEKQHAIVGQDTDALSNPVDAGMGWLIKTDKADFIGRDATLARLATNRLDRQVLTGFEVTGPEVPAEGASIIRDGQPIGRVTSAKWSPILGHPIGLAWLAVDAATEGMPVTIRLGVGTEGATVEGFVRTQPFHDPAGERLRA